MIPVLLLDIQSHHTVLDVCAAPGSKTEQMINELYNSLKRTHDSSLKSPAKLYHPTGCIIANDADPRRIGEYLYNIIYIYFPVFYKLFRMIYIYIYIYLLIYIYIYIRFLKVYLNM